MNLGRFQYLSKTMAIMAALFLLAGYITYHLAIRDTLDKYHQILSLEKKLTGISDAPQKIEGLRSDLHSIESKLHNGSNESSIILLGLVTNFCHEKKLVLKSFPATEEQSDGGMLLRNQSFIIEGSFKPILTLLHELEKNKEIGRVISVRFLVQDEALSKRRNLYASVIVQNIILNENES